MSWLHAAHSQHGAGAWLHASFGGQGVRGDAVPSTGVNGPALLYPGLSLPAEAADEFRASILSIPAALLAHITFGEDSSFEVSESAPAGVHVGSWRGYKNGAALLPDPSSYTITIGTGELSGGATLDGMGGGGGLGGGAPSGLSGGAVLDGMGASGGMGSGTPSALSGDAQLDGMGASGGMGGGTPSALGGDASLDGMGAGGGILGELPPSGDFTGQAPLDGMSAEGHIFGGAPSVLPRVTMDDPTSSLRIVRAGRTTPTYLAPLDVDEIDDIHFDFKPALVGVEPVLAVAVTCEARVGVDAAAAAMRVGDPVFGAEAAVQRIRAGLVDVIYLVRATATLATGRKVTASAFLPVARKL